MTPTQAGIVERERLIAAIPPGYSPTLHFAGTAGIGVLAGVIGALNIRHPSWRELMTFPLLFFVANAVEWRAHKILLHQRRWPLHPLFEAHSEHHRIYGHDSMEIRSFRELHRVLIPSVGVLLIVAVAVPFAVFFARWISPNTGWCLITGSALYVVSYEVTHLCYHLPSASRIGRARLIAVLREHHRRHHHPSLMQRWNFNVTVPLFDRIKGTFFKGPLPPAPAATILATAKKELEDATQGER